MPTQDIPREQWKTFLDDLSREHESGLVTVEVRGQPLPQQPALIQMTLLGLSLEDKGSGKGRIDIMVGSDTDNNASHTVAHPTLLKAETDATGDVVTLTIDAEEGEPVTIVRFLSAT